MTIDSAAVRATKGRLMKPWTEITHYAGFDWARDHHDVVVVDPRFRTRQMRTSALVWDGQTLALGVIAQNEVVTGNGTSSAKQVPEDSPRNLLVLVTPTIIDPAANRVHVDDEMPVMKR